MKDFRQGLPPGSTVVLLAVVLGASLRFTGIAWGLQHPPHSDEQAYVLNVNAMLDAGDLDHRYYYYPGLFFYLLAPILDLLGEARRHGPEAYLACRVFVATIASLNVWLAGVVARSLGGPWAAAFASLSLAVFPLSTSVAHEVRPDVCLETLGLLSLLLYARERWEKKEFFLFALLVGCATAIKFSGLLFLSGTTVAVITRKAGFKRWLLASMFAGVLVLLATPYAFLHADAFLGNRSELGVYFHGFAVEGLWRNAATYGKAVLALGGPLGVLIAFLGFAKVGPALRTAWLPWLAHFALTFAVFSLASIAFPRHLLQVTGGLCVLLGLGLARVALASRAGALILAALTLALPLRASTEAVLVQARPSAPDRARQWIDHHMKGGSVILESRRDAAIGARAGESVGVDRSRFEFLTPESPVRSELRLLMPHADLIIVDADRSATSLFLGSTVAYEAVGARGRPVLSLLAPGNRVHPVLAQPSSVSASTIERTAALLDERFATGWSTPGPMTGTEWMEFRFEKARRLCRAEIDMPWPARDHEPELMIRLAGPGGAGFRAVRSANARPSREDQVAFGRPRGQALVFEPEWADSLRIEQRGARTDSWAVSEVRLFECPDDPANPEPRQ